MTLLTLASVEGGDWGVKVEPLTEGDVDLMHLLEAAS